MGASLPLRRRRCARSLRDEDVICTRRRDARCMRAEPSRRRPAAPPPSAARHTSQMRKISPTRRTTRSATSSTYDLGVPRCCGAFTPSTRVVSRNDGSGWFLFRFSGCSDRVERPRCSAQVVGGLYGNVAALDALEEGMERERRHGLSVEVCFNGDFNFFNATSKTWARINRGVRALGHATAGNVEREALKGDGGCGCAYPDYVDGAFADRASLIVQRLRTVSTDPDIAAWLSRLPFAKTYVVGGVRVCCVHGYHTVSKSNVTRVDGVRVSSTPPPRHRRGGAQRRRDTRGDEPREKAKTTHKTQATRPARTAGPSTRPTCRAGPGRTTRRTSQK